MDLLSNIPSALYCPYGKQATVEIRGLEVQAATIDITISFRPDYEGERVRGQGLFCQMGDNKTRCSEAVKMAEMNEIMAGKVTIDGADAMEVEAV